MAQDRTSGFDMLIQISENELNAQIAAAFANGLLFPPSIIVPINAFGITGTLNLNLLTPVADMDRSRPQLGITVPFSESQIEITSPVSTQIAPLGGTIVIVDAVQIRTVGNHQQAVMDFTDGVPTVTVTFDSSTAALLTPILAGFGVTLPAAQNQVAGIIQSELQNSVQRIPLTPEITVADDSDPLTPFNFEVTTVNDMSAADRDALTFGVRTSSESGGNINHVNQSFIPAGSRSIIMLSNFWLLARVVRPRLAQALGRPITDFDTPLRLNHPIPVSNEHNATLTQLEGHIEGNRIRVDGTATASDTGWSAVSNFSFFISLQLQSGQITVVATEPDIDTDVDLEWWVWLLGIGLGGLFGGIIGAIVAAIVLAIVESVAGGAADSFISDAFNNAIGSIPPIPLGPLGSGLTLTDIILDDLELHGPIVRSLGLPVKNAGSHESLSGFTVDLDTGEIRNAGDVPFGTDLIWDPASGLDTYTGSGFTLSGISYSSLTPVQLEKMAFVTHHLNANSIPVSIDMPFFGIHNEVVFGVLTNEGRLAKVRAWMSALAGNALHLEWITYSRPIPTLDIALRWEILEAGKSTFFPGHSGDFQTCERFEVSRKCTIEAWPRLVSFPVNYVWCLCGTVLDKNEGEVSTENGPIAYRVSGRYLELTTGMGQAVKCELCVSAIDARNRELFTCVKLDKETTEVKCSKPKVFRPKPKIDIIPCDPLRAVDKFEAVLSDRVQKHLLEILQTNNMAKVSRDESARDYKTVSQKK